MNGAPLNTTMPPPCLPPRLPRPPTPPSLPLPPLSRLLTEAPGGLPTARFGRRRRGAGREKALAGRISHPREERAPALGSSAGGGQTEHGGFLEDGRQNLKWEGGGRARTPPLTLLLLLVPLVLMLLVTWFGMFFASAATSL